MLAAPRELVFKAFTDPTHLARWWGPTGFTNTFHAFDARPGGAWRFVMHGPNGANFDNESVFVELVPAERIVIRHVSPPRFELTVTLADRAGRTQLTWTMRFDSVAERDRIKGLATPANEQNLDRLEAELARMA